MLGGCMAAAYDRDHGRCQAHANQQDEAGLRTERATRDNRRTVRLCPQQSLGRETADWEPEYRTLAEVSAQMQRDW